MDFSLPEPEQAVSELAQRILGDLCTPERHKQLEAEGVDWDTQAWKALAEAGLVGISLPERYGGGGLGFLATCQVLEQVGRTTAKVPLLSSVAAMCLAEFWSERLCAQYLPGLASGERIIVPALVETGRELHDPEVRLGASPVTDVNYWRTEGSVEDVAVHGVKEMVPFAAAADHYLVSAATGDGVGLFLVDSGYLSGNEVVPQTTTSGMPEAQVRFRGAAIPLNLEYDEEHDDESGPYASPVALRWLLERCTAALCATSVGVVSEALRITAEYTGQREQFGRPIATFQAVGQRLGDAYIDTEAIKLTALQACWRLDQGLEASTEVAVAKYWAADGGQRVVNAAQHLHGGMGVDRDYPLWRYYIWAKHLELALGGATAQLLRIGEAMADGTV